MEGQSLLVTLWVSSVLRSGTRLLVLAMYVCSCSTTVQAPLVLASPPTWCTR